MNKSFPFRLDIAASPGQNDNEHKFLISHCEPPARCQVLSQLRAVDAIYDWCHLNYLGVGERGGSTSRADHLQWWSRLGGGTAAASSEYRRLLNSRKRE